MKFQKLTFILLLLAVSQLTFAQRKRISLAQADPRFTIWVESHYNFVNDESFYFYVENNTNDKYRLVVDVTLNSTCHPSRNFKLGINHSVFLPPNGTFTPKDDWVHNLLGASNAKDCRRKDGDSYTFLDGISYRYSEITNLTLEEKRKEEEAQRKKEEQEKAKLEAQRKKEEQEKARLEKEAANRKMEEERIAKEQAAKKKYQEERERLEANKSIQNNSGSASGQKSSASSTSNMYSKSTSANSTNSQQNVQAEIERQRLLQQEKKEELRRKQEIAKEEQEKKAREQYENLQRKIEENNRKAQALNDASTETMNQWQQGNYIQGSSALATEYARQGNSDAAYGTLAIGTGLQIASWINESNEQKRIEEERRAEERRRQEEERRRREEIEERKRQLLQEQKDEFNRLVQEQRTPKRNIINSREEIFNEQIDHTQTFDVFSDKGEPIYIYYVQTEKNFNRYEEKISFPDLIQIDINEDPTASFSPIIVIHPNANGEFPFVKDILSNIKSQFINEEENTYKIFNWSKKIEEIQSHYDQKVNQCQSANFSVVLPEKTTVELSNTAEKDENPKTDYWGTQKRTEDKSPQQKTKKIDYWGAEKKADKQKKDTNKKLDQWHEPKV